MQKKIILFGCGVIGYEALKYFGNDSVYCFADNNSNVIGSDKYGKPVISFDELLKIYDKYYVIISVNLQNAYEIANQFENNEITEYLVFEELKSKPEFKNNPSDLITLYSKSIENVAIQRDFYKEKSRKLERKLEYLIKHTNITCLKPATGYLRKRQLDIVNFASEFIEKIDNLRINPFLVAGNLLGFVRNDGFIPWDDDIDFGLIRKDYNKLCNYCKENFYVAKYDGEKEGLLEWVNDITIQHKNEYVFFIYSNHIQISKGTSCIDRLAIDFFAFDYYKEDYKFENHIEYVKSVKSNIEQYSTEVQKINYIESEIKNSRNIVDDSNFVYFGIDNLETFRRSFYNKWIDKNVLFPLKESIYEGKKFLVPNNPEEFIKYEYEDYEKLPNEFGEVTHSYWDEFKREKLINVEFYLIDAFEISHFKPIYEFLREKGINAIFIAEKNEINTAGGDWFNYDDAIKILEKEQLEYRTECNVNAQFAFTTQEISILKKYKNAKKINISYGLALNKNYFAYSKKTVNGFDYKFVHGQFLKDKLSKICSCDKLKIFGYPRHYNLSQSKFNKQHIKKELGINTSKKILCYLPTWDEDSSILKFKDSLIKLKEKYFIITKPHHVTCRNTEKKEELDALYEISDIVLDSEYDLKKFCIIGDVNICDAKSGASLESCFVNNESRVVFLSVRENLKEYFFEEIFEIAYLINDPLELKDVVESILIEDKFKKKRLEYINEFFENDKNNYLKDIFSEIMIF